MQRSFRLISLLLSLILCASPLCGCAILFPDAYATTTGGSLPSAPDGKPASNYDLVLRYDDRVNLTGKFLRIADIDTKDTSFLRTYPEDDGTLTVRATGVGSGKLYLKRNNEEICLRVLVEPAPLNVFLLLGEEAAHGTAEPSPYAPRSADGLIYYISSGSLPLDSLPNSYHTSVREFVPKRLTNNRQSLADTELPVFTNELTTSGAGRYAGLAAPLAYQTVEATGERVLMLNLAQPHASVTQYAPNEADPDKHPSLLRNALALWEETATVLASELEADHYTVSRFGFFFCQGESDASMSEDAYYEAFLAMKQILDARVTLSEDGRTRHLDFGGLILPRNTETAPTRPESGPRAAQRRIAAEDSGSLANVYLLSDAVDAWDTDGEVAAYFARYDFRNFYLYYGYEPPKTVAELFTGGSYTAAACNELGYGAIKTLLSLDR